ncbi:MAG: hypothetical protein DWC04_00625 [Candidatus Poseidoniales archaeon]|nr:MAG: hypothetical protein DWC04_00625 [Candidatus Poseidoniales archaeon]
MTIEERLIPLLHHLNEVGLIGPNAFKFGGPDELLLVSGGPPSHLAKASMLCGPSRRRMVIRQPKIQPSALHSPSKGDVRLTSQTSQLVGHIEEWKHGCWYHATTIFDETLAGLLEKLQAFSTHAEFEGAALPDLPKRPFWSGCLAYDLVQWTQPLALQHPPEEDTILCVLFFVERYIVENKSTGELHAFSIKGDDWSQQVSYELSQAQEKSLAAQAPNPNSESSNMTDEEHKSGIETIRESIAEGQMYQVNLGRWWRGKLNEHPRFIFERLCDTNPAPFSAYMHCEDLGLALVSSSPESLLQCDGVQLRTAPIKGTRPRGETQQEELRLRDEMINDEKERAEHRMLVDLMRNDLSSVCAVGSVEVERFDVEAYANVQHLVSQVTGELSPENTPFDALGAIFPGGSITGCPRTVVCATIDELEQTPRSFWTGSIGWFDPFSGAGTWNILIRTLIATRVRKQWHGAIAAGGGITIGSVAEEEIKEAKWKASALRKACGWTFDERVSLPQGQLAIHHLIPEKAPPTAAPQGTVMIDTVDFESEKCVLLIDNLDSFTQNIAHAVAGRGHNVVIHRSRTGDRSLATVNDEVDLLLQRLNPTHVILGPGPGKPSDSALTMEIAKQAIRGEVSIPVLGICLGHQAIGVAAGMNLNQTPSGPVHGSPRNINHTSSGLFEGLKSPHPFTLYNSLILASDADDELLETAHLEGTGEIMAIAHSEHSVFGVQFHPESVGSPEGFTVLANFLRMEADA